MARSGGPTTENDEATLIARAQRDRAAFAPLYERYADPIFRYCYRRLGNYADSEDATSHIFTKALDGLAGFRGKTLAPWLFTIADHVLVDYYRAFVPSISLDARLNLVDRAESPELEAERSEGRATLRTYLRQLSPDQRAVIELKLAGLKGPEIAEALDCPHTAVRARLTRATKSLRRLFGIPPGTEGDGDD